MVTPYSFIRTQYFTNLKIRIKLNTNTYVFFFSSGGFRQEFYIVLFLGQFAFMYLVFDAILYRKKAGLIYRLTRSCSSQKGTLRRTYCLA